MAKKKSVKKTVKQAAKAVKKAAGKPSAKKASAGTAKPKAVTKKATQKKTAKKKAAKPSKRSAIDRIGDVLQFPGQFSAEDVRQPPAIVTRLLKSIGISDPAELDLQGIEEVAIKLAGHPEWQEFRAGLLEYFGMTGDEWYMTFDDDQPLMCYEVKVTLKHTRPAVERVLHLPEMSFGELHDCIQVAMGWDNCHLHEFDVGEDRVGPVPDEEDEGAWNQDPDVLPEEDVAIGQAWQAGFKKFRYTYDFGDSWEHDITLVKAWPVNDERPTPKCVSGKLACPPEDCGGIPGYEESIDLLKRPAAKLDEFELERREWLGDWNPEVFDIDDVNSTFAQWDTPAADGAFDSDDDTFH